MKADHSGKTAKIYNFPKGGRASAPTRAHRGGASSIVTLPRAAAVTVSFGDAWYHDAAISDAQTLTKR